MADCECLPRCPFFHDRMANKPATASLLKNQFCLGDSTGCARHQVFKALGSPAVPSDLFPGQVEKAQMLISASKA